jgi:hypothetical protein
LIRDSPNNAYNHYNVIGVTTMSIDCPQTGYAKLYHPRGPLVSLPVPPDPKEAFDHIAKCLDVGWLVVAPGLEAGEQKDEVGYIVRGSHESNGEVTPTLLLYSTNEGLAFPFLKVYLNSDKDLDAFEHASGMRLDDFKEYVGADKPERGKSGKTDAFIVRVKKPFGVVFKSNPKYKDSDREAAEKAKQVYKVARRLFVRWADQVPASAPKPEPMPAANHSTKPPVRQMSQSDTEELKRILHQFEISTSAGHVEDWDSYARKQCDFPPTILDQIADAKQKALERINRAGNLRKPTGARRYPRLD